MRPIAKQTARMMAADYCRNHSLSNDDEENLPFYLTAYLNQMFDEMENGITRLEALAIENDPDALSGITFMSEGFKSMLRGESAGWKWVAENTSDS